MSKKDLKQGSKMIEELYPEELYAEDLKIFNEDAVLLEWGFKQASKELQTLNKKDDTVKPASYGRFLDFYIKVMMKDTVKPASIEDMMKDTVTEYEETVDQPVSQLSDLLSDTLEESADKGEAITFLNEKDIKESIKDLETDVQIEADNKGNVSRETSKKTKERIKRLKCSNKGV